MTSSVKLKCPHCSQVFDGDCNLEFDHHVQTHSGRNKNPKGYIAILGLLHDVAKQHGYALGIHGTLGRDLDLIAAPWVQDARSSEELVQEMARVCGGRVYAVVDLGDGQLVDNPVMHPHGREGWVVILGAGTYLDVSVMPKSAASSSDH